MKPERSECVGVSGSTHDRHSGSCEAVIRNPLLGERLGFISWWKGETEQTKQGLLDSFMDMPFILKMMALATLVPLGIFVIEINPNSRIAIDGELVTYKYLWKSGRVWHSMAGGIMMPISSYLLLRRERHSRAFCIFAWVVFWVWAGIIDMNGASWTDFLLHLLFITCAFWFYLYKRKPVVEYFSKVV